MYKFILSVSVLVVLLFTAVNGSADLRDDDYWDMWDYRWRIGLESYTSFGEALQHQPPLALNPVKCGRDNFDLFFLLFSEDETFQDAFIRFPLKYSTYGDYDYNKDMIVVYYVKSADSTLARVFPNRGQRGKNISCVFNYENPGKVVVGETSFGINFILEWDEDLSCWYLTEIMDYSV